MFLISFVFGVYLVVLCVATKILNLKAIPSKALPIEEQL
ncbi:hypothetical protein A343_1519 [Porphyromonas gingivalis JCVI SC001]|nr:hypothetical protein A343_1519 [Porphyromonas gingivalis JCVI SC001]